MLLYTQQSHVWEVVYMTAATRSDKGLSETLLGLVDAVFSSYHRYFAAFKFSIKPVNLKVSLCIITTSPIHYQVLFYYFVEG